MVDKVYNESVAEKAKQLEDQKAKVTDPKIKAAIDDKIKGLNMPINK